jgi:hypothetical protein
VIFYSSGVLKEGVLMAGLGLFFYGLFNLKNSLLKPKFWICLILGILILLIMKIYVFVCLVPAVIYFISSGWVYTKRPIVWFLVFQILVFAGMYILSITWPEKDIFYTLYKKKDDFSNVAMQYEAGSFIVTPDLLPNPISFLMYIPFALYTVIMRPYFWEQGSALVKVAGLENLLLLFFMMIPVFTGKKKDLQEKRITNFLLIFVLYLYILIGFTTPVLGALTRYKVPALPFLFIICLLCINTDRLKKFVPYKNL